MEMFDFLTVKVSMSTRNIRFRNGLKMGNQSIEFCVMISIGIYIK